MQLNSPWSKLSASGDPKLNHIEKHWFYIGSHWISLISVNSIHWIVNTVHWTWVESTNAHLKLGQNDQWGKRHSLALCRTSASLRTGLCHTDCVAKREGIENGSVVKMFGIQTLDCQWKTFWCIVTAVTLVPTSTNVGSICNRLDLNFVQWSLGRCRMVHTLCTSNFHLLSGYYLSTFYDQLRFSYAPLERSIYRRLAHIVWPKANVIHSALRFITFGVVLCRISHSPESVPLHTVHNVEFTPGSTLIRLISFNLVWHFISSKRPSSRPSEVWIPNGLVPVNSVLWPLFGIVLATLCDHR